MLFEAHAAEKVVVDTPSLFLCCWSEGKDHRKSNHIKSKSHWRLSPGGGRGAEAEGGEEKREGG